MSRLPRTGATTALTIPPANAATRWRTAETASEIVRNLRARPLRGILLLVLTTTALAAIGVAETRTIDNMLAASERDVAAGRHVYVVTPRAPSSEPTLPADECSHLNDLPQVVAAGGYEDFGFRDLDSSPGTPVRLLGFNGRLPAVLDPTLTSTAGGFISEPLYRQLGIAPDETPTIDNETLSASPFQPQPRFPNGETLVLQPITAQLVNECWFETTTNGGTTAPQVAFAAFSGVDVAVTPLLEAVDSDRYARGFRQRATRRTWLATGLLIGLVYGIGIAASRSQTALYRTLGASSHRAAIIAIGPAVILVTLATLWALLAATALTAPGASTAFDTAWLAGATATAASSLLAASCIAMAGIWVSRGAIADHLKERL